MGSSFVMLVTLFNRNRELKVDPFLDFVPILHHILGDEGLK
jgi:hypothetical protein